jgi:hypothetical protein
MVQTPTLMPTRHLRRCGIQAVIPVKEDQKNNPAPEDVPAGGRLPLTQCTTRSATPSIEQR